jgi:hypothetical protein
VVLGSDERFRASFSEKLKVKTSGEKGLIDEPHNAITAGFLS